MSASFLSFRNQLIKFVSVSIIGAIAFTPAGVLGQGTAKGGAITLRSDVQESNSETGVITARGNVKIEYPVKELQATAAQAQYFTRERRLVLTGNVYVLQQGNSMRAETLTYLVDEGKFIATPKSDRQVESTYIVTEPVPENNSEQLNN